MLLICSPELRDLGRAGYGPELRRDHAPESRPMPASDDWGGAGAGQFRL